jgi:hypothetical protein
LQRIPPKAPEWNSKQFLFLGPRLFQNFDRSNPTSCALFCLLLSGLFGLMSEENQKSISQSISETATAASNAIGGLYDKATGKATEPEHELPGPQESTTHFWDIRSQQK